MKDVPKTLDKLVYICGKTSTGKSTLSRQIAKEYSYGLIELDKVIYSLNARDDVNPFIETYIERREMGLINEFIVATNNLIDELLEFNNGVIVEGSIANLDTFNQLFARFKDDMTFIFLHPININVYSKRLKQRLDGSTPENRNGLPGKFWDKFSNEALSKYYNDRIYTDSINESVNSYALESIEESSRRLKAFQSQFSDIHIIEI